MLKRFFYGAAVAALALSALPLTASAEKAPTIVSYGTYRDRQGNIIVFGTLRNGNPFPASMNVSGDGVNAKGQVLESGTQENMHPVLAPGATFPFAFTIAGEDGDPAPAGITKIRFTGQSYHSPDVPVALKAALRDTHQDDGHTVQTVTLTNPARFPVFVQAAAVGYDAAGKVVDVEFMTDDNVTHVSGPNGDVDKGLGAGETGRMEFIPGNPAAVRWSVVATGVRKH